MGGPMNLVPPMIKIFIYILLQMLTEKVKCYNQRILQIPALASMFVILP